MSFNQLYLGSKFTHPKPAAKTKPEDEIIAFFVGEQSEEPFLINRELAIEASPVFRAASAMKISSKGKSKPWCSMM
jgi:hypothetical protein